MARVAVEGCHVSISWMDLGGIQRGREGRFRVGGAGSKFLIV